MTEPYPELHPATRELLGHFDFDHLPAHLQTVSRAFHALAHRLVEFEGPEKPGGFRAPLDGPEVSAGLRKLLEAKDCFVRAAVAAGKR